MDSLSSEDMPTRFIVPDEVLATAHDWQVQHGQILTLAMPAEEQAWRDNQHYRAYVRDVPAYLYDICPEEL